LVVLDLSIDEKPITIVVDEGALSFGRVNSYGLSGFLLAIPNCQGKNCILIFFSTFFSLKNEFHTHTHTF
jgi:hypothetical protein